MTKKEAHTANNHELPPQFKYNRDTGPTVIKPDDFIEQVLKASPNDELELNCQLFASAVTRARGYSVPDDYRSSEHYEDPDGVLKDIPQELAEPGDIIGLSGHPRANPKQIHLAVVKHNENGEIQLIHAAKDEETVAETPLHVVQTWEYHETVRFVKRPIEIFNGRQPNHTALRKLKFLSE